MTRDDRLHAQGALPVDASRHASGLTESRYPVRAAAVHPLVLAASGSAPCTTTRAGATTPASCAPCCPACAAVLEAFLARRVGRRASCATPEGWNDSEGTRELADERAHALAARLDAAPRGGARGRLRRARAGGALAAPRRRDRRRAATGRSGASRAASTPTAPAGASRSELVQSLALLSGGCPARAGGSAWRAALFAGGAAPRSGRSTPLHYLFEAARLLGRPDVVLDRLAFCGRRCGATGCRTPIESAEPTRSDCHAWGSHPLFHFFATLLGIRPGGAGGFARWRSRRCSARSSTRRAASSIPRAARSWSRSSRRAARSTAASCCRPGLAGTLRLPSGPRPLAAGETRF